MLESFGKIAEKKIFHHNYCWKIN